MSYYTDYSVSVQNASEADLRSIEKYLTEEIWLEPWGDGWSGNLSHDIEDEMRALSAAYPDVLFTVYGVGEMNDDMFYEYYKAGKMQRCPAIITFDPYDETKLE